MRLADLNAFDAGDGDDVAGRNFLRFVALEAAKGEKLGDFRGLDLAVEFRDADFGAAIERSLENAGNGDAAEKIAVIEIGDLNLQHGRGIARRRGNRGDDFLEQRLEVRGGIAELAVRDAGLRVRVDHRKIELIFGGVEIDEEIVDFVEHCGGARVGAVDLIQHDDRRKLRGERFLQHVARLRQRAFAGVHQNQHAIHHAQRAFHFAAEIAVAGRVDDIDFRVVIGERGILGENRDAALALEIVRVHHALDDVPDWRGKCRSGGAWRRPAWSCRGRRGR